MQAIVQYVERDETCTRRASALQQYGRCCDPQQLVNEAQGVAAAVLDALNANTSHATNTANHHVVHALQQLTARNVQGCCADPDAAEALRAKASDAFGQQRYQDALTTYSRALQCAGVHVLCKAALRTTLERATVYTGPAHSQRAATVAYLLLCNRSLCWLRITPPNPAAAATDAHEAIRWHPERPKARRACSM